MLRLVISADNGSHPLSKHQLGADAQRLQHALRPHLLLPGMLTQKSKNTLRSGWDMSVIAMVAARSMDGYLGNRSHSLMPYGIMTKYMTQ